MVFLNGLNKQPIEMVRGDSELFQIGISVNGSDYTPVEGDVVSFRMWDRYHGIIFIEKEVPISTMQMEIEPEDTESLPFGTYEYDMKITFADGDVKTFIEASPFFLKKG